MPALLIACITAIVCTALPAQAQGVTLDAERVDVVHGRALVIPVKVSDRRSAERPVEIKLEDTRRIDARVYWMSPVVTGDSSAPAWVAPSAHWRAWSGRPAWQQAQAAAGGAAPGRWYLIADLPIDAVGQGIWLAGERHAVQWLPDPHRLADADGPAWSSPLPEGASDDPLVRAGMAAQFESPLTTWRGRLMEGTLPPGGPLGERDGSGGPVRSFDALRDELEHDAEGAGAIETLADWMTSRWQLALAWVHAGDPVTARRLRTAVAGVVQTESGWAPAYFSDLRSLNELLLDLLNPFVDAQTRALRAEAWLGTQPGGAVWVIDDSGPGDGGALDVTIGVVSLADRPANARAEPPGQTPEFIEVEPRREQRFRITIDATDGGPRGGLETARVPVAVGRWSSGVEPIESVLSARPPGVRAGPLLHEWTMDAWLTGKLGEAAVPAPGQSAAALLYRSDEGGANPRSGWRILIECSSADERAVGDDLVRLWFGPFGFATSVIEVSSDGNVRATIGPEPDSDARVVQRDGKWTADLPVPPAAIGDDGIIRLGLERIDALSVRTSWPRRMLPWQTEPGRLAFDLTDWDGLGR